MKDLELFKKLELLGLSEREAHIYKALLDHGFTKAGNIPRYVKMKRGIVYKVLEDLIEKGFVEKHGGDATIARYSPLSPKKLYVFVEKQEEKLKEQKEIYDSIYGNLKSQFNLLSGKPSVQYFEGEKGIKKVIEDSLFAETEVLQYIDSESLLKEIPQINEWHAKKRKTMQIYKKMLIPDTKFMKKRKKHLSDELTNVRIIPKLQSFPNVMQIYDNKIAYISFNKGKRIGVIIEDKDVCEMHRALFNAQWNLALE